MLNFPQNARDHFSCDCDPCEFAITHGEEIMPKRVPPQKPIQQIQDKDLGLLLRKLQAPNKLTRSVRIRIPETCVCNEGEIKFIAYYDESEGFIKFIQKPTFQQTKQFLNERRPPDSLAVIIKYIDNNMQVMTDMEFTILMMKRKIDPIWSQILYIQNFNSNKNYELQHYEFKHSFDSKYPEFDLARIEILILNGEIARASSDFVPMVREEAYENSLSQDQYCRYMVYKMVHYADVFGGIQITEGKFSFHKKTFISMEKMEYTDLDRKALFDSEILLRKKKMIDEDMFQFQKLIDQNVKKEREYALKVYREILDMDNGLDQQSHLLKNKLSVIGYDLKKYSQSIQSNFQQVMVSKDPASTLKELVIEQKVNEEKLTSILKPKKGEKTKKKM
ncbi:unnamed protein product (macronuclear) [Paramecium tetraurelia]|uniref:DM10 domain-containing protein n=1 Tax=Paramecium tetraurelia TaxID=5888 RepID=A0BDZ0_PARTE|nr:uncharacterized protein GSPATT00027788001 [Paramecium tetraurelia]CAK56757.1 unnamed protein product [Paramecium tetraurelia]|eukprot:XP_001424155.1 hypothetical protein (macronuclear) [Paramecium tetraurelia strain d4-2]